MMLPSASVRVCVCVCAFLENCRKGHKNWQMEAAGETGQNLWPLNKKKTPSKRSVDENMCAMKDRQAEHEEGVRGEGKGTFDAERNINKYKENKCMPEPETLKVYERRVAAKVSFSFFFLGRPLSCKTKCWPRIMCVCVCVGVSPITVSVWAYKAFYEPTSEPPIYRYPARTPHSCWPRRIWNARHAAWTLSNNFPPCLLPRLAPSPCPGRACRHLGYCCSSSFFAFDFIANWPSFWVDCLGRRPNRWGCPLVGSVRQSCSPTMFHDSCHRWALHGRDNPPDLQRTRRGPSARNWLESTRRASRKYLESTYLARMGSKIAVPNSFRAGQP